MLSEHDYECATCGMMASEHISVTSMCKVLRAVTNRESALIVANRELQDEVNEQCLLLGKSSERECVLRGRLEQLQRKRDIDHTIAIKLAEALVLTFKHWVNTDEAKGVALALAAWKGGKP
jgi:hypothetical protein